MMKKAFILLFILFTNVSLFSQSNLVKDPSFEGNGKYYDPHPVDSTCDTNIYIHNWTWPLGSPGYYNSLWNTCEYNQGSGGTPKNTFGFAYPVDSNGYFGLDLGAEYKSCGHPEWINYEYVEGELLHPLEQGKKYCVSFYAHLADSCTHTTYCVGAYLSKDFIPDMNPYWDTIDNYYLHFTPQIKNAEKNFLDDTVWIKIEGEFIAEGGEKYITIGNFNKYDSSQFKVHENIEPFENTYCGAYYYIDMVSVVLCDPSGVEEVSNQKNNEITVYPNPAKDYISVKYNIPETKEILSIQIFDILGNVVNTSELTGSNGKTDINLTNLQNGTYIYKLISNNKTYKVGKVVVIK